MVLLTNWKIFYLEKSFFAGVWEVDWLEEWHNVKGVTVEGVDQLRITFNEVQATGPMCFFGGTINRSIVDSNEDHIKVRVNEIFCIFAYQYFFSQELYENVLRHIEVPSASPKD